MTFAVFAKNTTGFSPDMSSGLAFLAREDEWRALMQTAKRNKTNTLNYSTFTLQVGENSMHDALCYSTTKRAILAEKEASRTPIKIARFTRTADHTKIVVNDITHVMAPNSLECPFQFCQNPDNQTTTTLEKLDEAPED